MPNWVTSKLTITGPNAKEVMKSLVTKNEENEDQFDFNKIVPMPKDLEIVSGSLTDRAIEVYLTSINPAVKFLNHTNKNADVFNKHLALANSSKLFQKYNGNLSKDIVDKIIENYINQEDIKTLEDLIAYGQKAIENIEKYDAMDWYQWSIRNWGTKWNACHNIYNEQNTPTEIRFDTAWGNVAGLMALLSKKFPENEFEYVFSEEQIGIQTGNLTFKNGEIIDGTFYDDLSKQAYEIAFELWGDDLKDYYTYDEEKQTYVHKDEEENSDEEEM